MLNKKHFIELCILINVKSKLDWYSIKQLINKRIHIPYPENPEEFYGDDVWILLKDAIRTKKVASYSHSSAIAENLGMKSKDDWVSFYNQVSLYRIGFPINPEDEFKNQWKGWDAFLSNK